MVVHLQKKTGKKIKPETFKSVRTVQDADAQGRLSCCTKSKTPCEVNDVSGNPTADGVNAAGMALPDWIWANA